MNTILIIISIYLIFMGVVTKTNDIPTSILFKFIPLTSGLFIMYHVFSLMGYIFKIK